MVLKTQIRSLSCPPKIQGNSKKKVLSPKRRFSTNTIYSKNQEDNDFIQVVMPKGQAAKKLEDAAPYNFFLTSITDSPLTHNEPLTITFQEILDKSLGEIECSVQINFIVDVYWLLSHYYFAGCLKAPLLILYGDEDPHLLTITNNEPQVLANKIRMFSPYATHHTKMMLLGYKDGSMRVVISTANLYENDWHNRTEGIWISPKLNAMPENANASDGESQTGFRQDLIFYLEEYKNRHLQAWIARIKKTNFSSINVFLIASIPGRFSELDSRGYPWGHARLGKILSKHSAKIDASIPVVAQSSSIGNLGPNEQSWILYDIINSLGKYASPIGIRRLPPFKMIYPSFNNVKNSHDGMLGGSCLPYSKNANDKQPWLRIICTNGWSDEGLYWFFLTSANLSKVAWGTFDKKCRFRPTLRISNYEAGVLFLPKLIINQDTFPLHSERDGIPAFPMPYDIPLAPYTSNDEPFVRDN